VDTILDEPVRGCRKHVRHMWHMWLSNCIIINVGVLANNHKGTLMSGLSSSLYCLDSLYLVRTYPPYLLVLFNSCVIVESEVAGVFCVKIHIVGLASDIFWQVYAQRSSIIFPT
jgi:hypothetical protein